MSALWLDVEVSADREEELKALFAELAAEDEADDLPPIIQDEVPGGDWEWAA